MAKYPLLLVVIGSILWGTDSLFRRPLSQDFSPVTIVFLEHLVLVIVLLPFLYRSRALIALLGPSDWISMVFIAVGGSVAATSLFTYAIKHGNPSVTVLLQKTQPFFTLMLARSMLHERPGKWFWYCLIPAVTGAYLVSTPDWRGDFLSSLNQPPGIFAALAASVLWGSSTVLGRYIIARMPILILTGLRFLLAFPVLLILYCIQPASDRLLPATFAPITTVALMALIPGLLALIFYYRGLQQTTASVACVGELAFPLTAVLTNWYILNIKLAKSQLLGGSVLVAAVVLLSYLNTRPKDRDILA